jgi:hypothetical protein
MAGRVYSKEEAEAILARAIELQVHQGATSHDDLVAAAKEVGVSAATIERAASEVLARKRDEVDMRDLRARQWRGLIAHLVPYLMVNALLAFLNVMTGGFPWMIIVLLGWGIGVASHLVAVAVPDQRKLRRHLERERARDARRMGRYRARIGDTPAGVRVSAPEDGSGEGDIEEQAAIEEAARVEAARGSR